jgi:predicted PurR-regulated permease PerM
MVTEPAAIRLDPEPRPEPQLEAQGDKILKAAIVGIFLILLIGLLYFAKDFLLPVSLAFLLAFVLSPVVRSLRKRGVPETVSALLLVLTLLTGLGLGIYGLSGPLSHWIDDAPNIAAQMKARFATLRGPLQKVIDASGQVEAMAKGQNRLAQEVVLQDRGLLTRAASGASETVTQIGVTLILLLFLLASGDMFYEKLVKSLPTFGDKLRGVKIARDIEREISRYLLTFTLINAGLGVAIALAMYAAGLPNPALWGVMAALFNYVPYVGAFTGLSLVTLVSIVSIDPLSQAVWPPLVYATIILIEGQFLSPFLVGRRLELNVVAVFLAVVFWTWVWGVIGAFIAVPMLVTVKVFADHVDGLGALGEFLAARDVPTPANTDAQQ